jgi:hypothetical protein
MMVRREGYNTTLAPSMVVSKIAPSHAPTPSIAPGDAARSIVAAVFFCLGELLQVRERNYESRWRVLYRWANLLIIPLSINAAFFKITKAAAMVRSIARYGVQRFPYYKRWRWWSRVVCAYLSVG